jgi:hypothetical protein
VDLKWAFVLGEEELKKLSRLLNERIGKVEYSATCADDVSRSFASLNEVISYENAKPRQITRFRISALSDDFHKRATVEMVGSSWRGISLDLHGRDDVVDRLRAELLEILSGIRPWYGSFQRVDFVALLFVFTPPVLLLLFLIRVALRPNPAGTSTGSNPRMDAIVWLIVIGTYASFLVVGFLLNRFRDSIFPSVFLIGQGKARFQHLERIHWGIGIAFVVSLVAGIVVTVL